MTQYSKEKLLHDAIQADIQHQRNQRHNELAAKKQARKDERASKRVQKITDLVDRNEKCMVNAHRLERRYKTDERDGRQAIIFLDKDVHLFVAATLHIAHRQSKYGSMRQARVSWWSIRTPLAVQMQSKPFVRDASDMVRQGAVKVGEVRTYSIGSDLQEGDPLFVKQCEFEDAKAFNPIAAIKKAKYTSEVTDHVQTMENMLGRMVGALSLSNIEMNPTLISHIDNIQQRAQA